MAAAFATAGAVRADASPPVLPALVQPATQEHHVGKIVFAELVTPDLETAKSFYGKLFGWTYQDIRFGRTHFAEATLNGRPVAGIVEKSLPQGANGQPFWLSFIASRDVDVAAGIALQHGAKLLFKMHDIRDLGREAVFADPQGAIFAMLASSSGDPSDYLADPGSWIWSSLITNDPVASVGFYKAVFGYDSYDLPGAEDSRHFILASDNYSRASVNPLPSVRPDARPSWLNFIRVEDVTAMAAKVVALGGRNLVPPHVDRKGDEVAVVADPSGAVFGLLEWSAAEAEGDPK